MATGVGSPVLPDRLPGIDDRPANWLRAAWIATLAFATLMVIAGTIFAIRDAKHYDLPFANLGLATQIETDGSITVRALDGAVDPPAQVPFGSRIRSIDGEPVAQGLRYWTLSDRLRRPPGRTVALTVEQPDGATVRHSIEVSPSYRAAVEREALVGRDMRFLSRMVSSLLACLTLLACAVLLYLRRPRDPVACLFSFSFLLTAAVTDPAMQLWIALDFARPMNVVNAIGWAMLVLGIATFPDGSFVPRFMRWSLLLIPLLAVPLVFDELSTQLTGVVNYLVPLTLLFSQVVRFRRYPPGVERQQIKWAGFGFAVGLACISSIYLFFPMLSPTDPYYPIWGMLLVLVYNLGYAVIVLGLLVSLLRFRLWEADRVISRSAVAATVTLAVGILWALGIDLVKTVVGETLGEDSDMIATAVGAVLAAGVFAPTQALAQKWATHRLSGDQEKMNKLVARLAAWRTTETPEEIGQRALSAIASATHTSCSAILLDTPRGLSLIASRDIADAAGLASAGMHPEGDPRFPVALSLEDEDGPIGWLLAGPRTDGNRYNSAEMAGLALVTEPLAEALRTAARRSHESDAMRRMLGTVEERLARLEGLPGEPKPA